MSGGAAELSAAVAEVPRWKVDSATGVDVELPIAGPGARALAFSIDWLLRAVLAAIWYALAALLCNWFSGRGLVFRAPPNNRVAWYFAVVLPPLAIYFLYHPLLELALGGRTPGKRRAGIQIVAQDGAAPGLSALLLRNVFRLIDCFPGMYGIGLLSVALTRQHRRIGDLAGGTLVVYAPARAAAPDRSAADDVLQLVDDYRLLARKVAKNPGDEIAAAEYALAHGEIFRPAFRLRAELRSLFGQRIPQAMRWLRPYLAWVTLLFLLATAAGWGLVHRYPDLARLFASQEMINAVERGELWTDGMLNIVPSSVMSAQILTNNIMVSLFAFVAGFLFGLGTLYIVGLNGMMLGAMFAMCAQHGMEGRLFEFIVAHGLVELSCICISGAAGAAVGEALMRPALQTRSAAFAAACRRSAEVLLVVVLLLIGCGLIEGFVSPNPDMPLATRMIVGFGYFFVMVALLSGGLAGRGRSAALA